MTKSTCSGPRALTVPRPWWRLALSPALPVPMNPYNRDSLHGLDPTWRGELFLHAGRAWDPAGETLARRHQLKLTKDGTPDGYVGLAELVDIHRAGESRCRCDPMWAEPGVHHLVFAHVVAFTDALPGAGRQGFFPPDQGVVDALPVLLGDRRYEVREYWVTSPDRAGRRWCVWDRVRGQIAHHRDRWLFDYTDPGIPTRFAAQLNARVFGQPHPTSPSPPPTPAWDAS